MDQEEKDRLAKERSAQLSYAASELRKMLARLGVTQFTISCQWEDGFVGSAGVAVNPDPRNN